MTNPLRSHVDLMVDDAEAAVVRRIFDLYDSGLGLKAITKRLTTEGAVSPRPFKRRDGLAPISGWSPSTVRTVLTRELYRGVKPWNKSRKRTPWGKVDQRQRPETDWIRAERKDLQIVPDDLWARVASRRAETEGRAVRFNSGRLSGRPPKHATKNLLAGLATCGLCGGGLVVETSSRKNGRIAEYVCHRHRHKVVFGWRRQARVVLGGRSPRTQGSPEGVDIRSANAPSRLWGSIISIRERQRKEKDYVLVALRLLRRPRRRHLVTRALTAPSPTQYQGARLGNNGRRGKNIGNKRETDISGERSICEIDNVPHEPVAHKYVPSYARPC